MKGSVRRERSFNTAESETLGMCGDSMRRNREALQTPTLDSRVGRSKKAKGRNVDMHVCGESDGLIVPTKRANKAGGIVLARSTPGFTGADLENLVNEAALLAARSEKEKVDMLDLELAKDKVMMGAERRSMIIS